MSKPPHLREETSYETLKAILAIVLVAGTFVSLGYALYYGSLVATSSTKYYNTVDRLWDLVDRYYHEGVTEKERPFLIFKMVSGREWFKVYNCTKEEYINGSTCEPFIIFVLNEEYTEYNITYYNQEYKDYVNEVNTTLQDIITSKKAFMEKYNMVLTVVYTYILFFFIITTAMILLSRQKQETR